MATEPNVVREVLQACLDLGVAECCVCAGSRNSDLVFGLLDHPDEIRVRPFFEERSAAFFAIGRIRATGRPGSVLTTSGTAAAELLPAAIEAYYQALPLVLLTADRPARFRGSGAPQAIEQAGLLEPYAPCIDISGGEAMAMPQAWAGRQPLHLNICMEEPGDRPPKFALCSTPYERPLDSELSPAQRSKLDAFLKSDAPLLVMAGCLEPEEAHFIAPFLSSLDAPIAADATSGFKGGPLDRLVLQSGERCLGEVTFGRVLRVGGVPSFRAWRDLECRPEIDVLSISRRPFTGLARPSTLIPWPTELPDPAPVQPPAPARWQKIDRHYHGRLTQLRQAFPGSEPAMVAALSETIPSEARIFLGNSLPVREWGSFAVVKPGQRIIANRGANGIDGNLSTFLGFATDARVGEECWGIFGDLTALYDLSAPHALPADIPCRFVIINNRGGKIFRRLPNFRRLTPQTASIFENPHQYDFAAWAKSWGLAHLRMTPDDRVLLELSPRPTVIELIPDEAQSEAFWEAWRAP